VQHVEDKDLGFGAMARATAKADGLELRNGILNWKLRYPRSGGGARGQEVAKVAAILRVHTAIASGYDAARGSTDAAFDRIHKELLAGRTDTPQRIHALMGKPIQAAMRAAAMRVVQRRSGRMAKAIRSTVFEGGRVGSRRAASSGTVAAGDDPRRPREGDAV